MSNSYICDWERLRQQLVTILTAKGKTVASDAPMATLVPLVNGIGVNNIINSILNNTAFDLIDTDGIITTISTGKLANTKLNQLVLPAIQSVPEQAFQNSTITSATLATENPDACNIGGSAFAGCTLMTELICGKIICYANGFIDGCTSLLKIAFNSFYTSGYAFRNNPNLKVVDFGYTPLFYNTNSHFNYSPSIKALVIRTTSVAELGGTTPFSWLLNNVTGWYIYVPDSLVDSYKAANNWSTFANYFKPLSEYDEEAILNGGQ